MKNIYDYFTDHLHASPWDKTLSRVPIESPVGRSCKKIIDTGVELIALLDPAVETDGIVEAIERAVIIEWRS